MYESLTAWNMAFVSLSVTFSLSYNSNNGMKVTKWSKYPHYDLDLWSQPDTII